jgi:predicted transglutaminase-like cysteine proteinase
MTTGLIEYKNDHPKYSFVRDGIAGNMDVIGRMIDIVKDATVLDKGFEDFVKQTTANNGFNAYSNTDDLFKFWYSFIKYPSEVFTGVDYIQDIKGRTESIKDARTTLQDGYGDCDDFAILYATILADLGYSPCFVLAKYPESDTFQHVYTVVYVNDKRYVFDGTIPNGTLNSEANGLDKTEVCIYDENEFTHPVKAAFRNLKNLVLQTKKNAQSAAPQLIQLLPMGGLLEKTVASSLFSGAQEEQSFNTLASELSGEITDAVIRMQNGTLSKESALGIARKRYAQLFTVDRSQINPDTFSSIESKIINKITYIENFVPYGTASINVSATGLSSASYVLIGIAGLGIWYFWKSNNIRF